MNMPNDELESVASRIARETMEVWETHVWREQTALVESHQEGFSVLARAGVHVGERSVTECLIDLVRDEDNEPLVRREGASVLGQIGSSDPAVIEALTDRLDDEHRSVREAAAEALDEIGTSDSAVRQSLLKKAFRSDEVKAFGDMVKAIGEFYPRTPTRQDLIERLNDEDPQVRESTAKTLGRISPSDPVVIEALIDRLKDEELGVRKAVGEALGQITPSDSGVIETLIELLNDEGWLVRMAAAETIGEIAPSDRTVTRALIERLGDKDGGVRSAAADALGQIGVSTPLVVEALTKRLDDKELWVCLAAAEALSQIGAPNPAVVKTLLRALDRTNGRSADRIAEVLSSLPWHILPVGRSDKEVQRVLPIAQRGQLQMDEVVHVEDGDYLIVHWQELARLPE